jgi:hypothetical protein
MRRLSTSIAGLCIFSTIGLTLLGCARERPLYSTKHRKYLSELSSLDCEEYTRVAVCEMYALLFNVGHSKSTYSDGKVTFTTLFGDLSRTVPLRCNLDPMLRELVSVDNEKGVVGRFGDSFTLVGQRVVSCENVASRAPGLGDTPR